MALRPTLVRLHRWAGLATALFLAIAGLTGSALAFKDELEGWLNPRLFVVPVPPDRAADDFIDPLRLREVVAGHFPFARADHVGFARPGRSQMFFLLPKTDPATGGLLPLPVDQAFLDPYTGALLGSRKWGALFEGGTFRRENLVPFLWRLHEAIALPHPWGKVFMGLVALVWTVDCFIGLALTWPRGRPFWSKWRIAWSVRRGASWKRLNVDVHRAGALWLWIALLVFAWSSVMLNLRDSVYRPVMAVGLRFDAAPQPPRLPRAGDVAPPALDWEQARAAARAGLHTRAEADGFAVIAEESLWYWPRFRAWRYRTLTSADLRDRNGVSDLWIDGDSGAVLLTRFETRGAPGDRVSAWLQALHTAEIWGGGYRLFVAVLGVLVAVLAITGVVIWDTRRRARLARPRASPPFRPCRPPACPGASPTRRPGRRPVRSRGPAGR